MLVDSLQGGILLLQVGAFNTLVTEYKQRGGPLFTPSGVEAGLCCQVRAASLWRARLSLMGRVQEGAQDGEGLEAAFF